MKEASKTTPEELILLETEEDNLLAIIGEGNEKLYESAVEFTGVARTLLRNALYQQETFNSFNPNYRSYSLLMESIPARGPLAKDPPIDISKLYSVIGRINDLVEAVRIKVGSVEDIELKESPRDSIFAGRIHQTIPYSMSRIAERRMLFRAAAKSSTRRS